MRSSAHRSQRLISPRAYASAREAGLPTPWRDEGGGAWSRGASVANPLVRRLLVRGWVEGIFDYRAG